MEQFTDFKNWPTEWRQKLAKIMYTQMPSLESITRWRRKYQADGQYTAKVSTRSARQAKSKAMKAMFR